MKIKILLQLVIHVHVHVIASGGGRNYQKIANLSDQQNS